MEKNKHLSFQSKVQSAVFIYTESIVYFVCVTLIYLFFVLALIVPV